MKRGYVGLVVVVVVFVVVVVVVFVVLMVLASVLKTFNYHAFIFDAFKLSRETILKF